MWALSALRQGTRSLPAASHSQGALIGLTHHLLQLSESTAPTVTVTIRSLATDNPGAEQPHASAPDFKPALLDAALKHVGTHGWSRAAVAAAARESGLSPAAAGVLEYDGDLVHHFMSKCNRHLETALQAEDLEGLRIKQRVARGVQLRLVMNIPYIGRCATCWRG
jgi:ubiquinone biosynthesis protein COQ9